MHKQNQTGHTRIARENGLATINRGGFKHGKHEEKHEKKQEKGMNRTEFAQDNSMDLGKSNANRLKNSRKQRTPKRGGKESASK